MIGVPVLVPLPGEAPPGLPTPVVVPPPLEATAPGLVTVIGPGLVGVGGELPAPGADPLIMLSGSRLSEIGIVRAGSEADP